MVQYIYLAYGIGVGMAYGAVLHHFIGEPPWALFAWMALFAPVFGLFGWRCARLPLRPWQMLFVIPLGLPVIISVLMSLVLILGLVVAGTSIWALPAARIERRRERQRLLAQGRIMPLAELQQRLDAGVGTLIREFGLKGCRRVWWTPDDLLASGELPLLPEECREIDCGNDYHYHLRCVSMYLDPDVGRAKLTPLSPKERPPQAGHSGVKNVYLVNIYPRDVLRSIRTLEPRVNPDGAWIENHDVVFANGSRATLDPPPKQLAAGIEYECPQIIIALLEAPAGGPCDNLCGLSESGQVIWRVKDPTDPIIEPFVEISAQSDEMVMVKSASGMNYLVRSVDGRVRHRWWPQAPR